MVTAQIDEPIVCIVGATAAGKTAVAMELARIIHGEIISADSMAIYRGMDIGTAKPSTLERTQVRFHLLDVAEPNECFNVARFKLLAEEAYDQIRSRHGRTILVGGTGLYVRAFLEDYNLTKTPADVKIRKELEDRAEREGLSSLHSQLCSVDPEAGRRIHQNDRIRIIRALEVYQRSGVPISVQQQRDKENRNAKDAVKFILHLNRDELNRRIDERVDLMIEQGLEREVRTLVANGVPMDSQSMRSLGYKEMLSFIIDKIDFTTAVDLIRRNTRKFAKRQLVWFRADADLIWLDVNGMDASQVAQAILCRL